MTATVAEVARPEAPAPPPGRPNRVGTSAVLGPSIASGTAVLLAALALAPLFGSGDWLGATVLTVSAVVAAGGLATALRAPLVLVPVLQGAAMFTVLVARFAADAPLGFVPSPDALASLREVLAAGMADIDRYAPPVPATTGVTAVTALGMGCVAVVVAVLQVNLRMPVAAGLALVAVYVVPGLVLDEGAPWWGFAAVAAGWMVLLVSDERVGVAGWGRALRRPEGRLGPTAVSGLSSAGLRIGTVAILLAVLLPILVPSLADAVLGRHETGFGSATGPGAGTAQAGVDAFVSLRRDLLTQSDVVLFRYTTTAPKPSYLRAVVLEQYAGDRWTARAFDPSSSLRVTDEATLAPSVGTGVATVPRTYRITDDGLSGVYVPLPEETTAVRGLAGQWYDDLATGTVFGVDSTPDGSTWTADALEASPTTAQLQAASNAGTAPDIGSLRDSTGIPADVSDLAHRITASATTDFERAVLLQDWFLSNFRYSTAASPDQSTSALESFLRDKSGYCQQFAAAMALMARSLGIPARVVVGFTPGTFEAGTWVVRGRDAHAWPELELPGVGWVRFEPTPRGAADGGSVTVPAYAASLPTSPDSGASSGGGASSGAGGTGKLRKMLDQAVSPTPTVDLPSQGTTPDQWRVRALVALALAGAVVALLPAVRRWVRRRRRLSSDASVEAAWEELRDTARDLGISWPDAATPRQAVAGVVAGQRLSGSVAEAATRIGRVTERARYAATPPSTDGLVADVGAVRAALLHRVDRPTRLRAAFMPASLRRRSR